jgi:hypothetical protein
LTRFDEGGLSSAGTIALIGLRGSLGTNAELGLVTNGLFEVPLDGGAENCSIR